MAHIISEEKFKSQCHDLWQMYRCLREKYPDDARFKKAARTLKLIRTCYPRDKAYAVKYLRLMDKYLVFFHEERRALFVKYIELVQKVLLHKKLNPNRKTSLKRKP